MENKEMDALDAKVFGSAPFPNAPSHRLKIIEDMVYWGTELGSSRQTASYINDDKISKDTVVLLGLSKWGLPGMRSSIIVSHQSFNRHLFKHFYASCNYAPQPSVVALGKAFSDTQIDTERRNAHLRKLNGAHRYGLTLLRTLIAGLNKEPVSTELYNRMIKDVETVTGNREDAEKFLRTGIPEIVPASHFPESGFFQLLDFKTLIGRTPTNDLQRIPQKHHGKKISSASELNKIFLSFGVHFLKGSVLGLPSHTPVMRANAGLPPHEIVEGMKRLQTAVQHLRP